MNNYIFMGDLPKATINAVIKVSAEGRGVFIIMKRTEPGVVLARMTQFYPGLSNEVDDIYFGFDLI